MANALAMRMKLELAQLARRHRVGPQLSCALPLAPPVNYPVRIDGIAVSNTLDQERMRFRAFCPSFNPYAPPPLLFRHNHKQPAGAILGIRHDDRGRLIISARVDHHEAARCQGFSIAATIGAFEIVNPDDPLGYYALITRAWLDEVSLTPAPADLNCVVTSRIPDNPTCGFYSTAIMAVEKCQEYLRAVERVCLTQPAPDSDRSGKVTRTPSNRTKPARPTEFSALVRQLEARHPA
jgi:hypothetical protein